jgi:hypothetical protein
VLFGGIGWHFWQIANDWRGATVNSIPSRPPAVTYQPPTALKDNSAKLAPTKPAALITKIVPIEED